jgi:molybdopterin converting factor subunit 1
MKECLILNKFLNEKEELEDNKFSNFSMKINVKFFALGRELVGNSSLEFEMEENGSVQSLIESLKNKHPKLKELKSFLVAVNMEYADMQQSLKDGDEVAIIPPVSGG